MNVFYIYLLSISGEPAYIGITKNLGVRLTQHIKNPPPGLHDRYKKINAVSEISISVLDVYKSKTPGLNKSLRNIEWYWINFYIAHGHDISNKLIKNCSKLRLKYYKTKTVVKNSDNIKQINLSQRQQK